MPRSDVFAVFAHRIEFSLKSFSQDIERLVFVNSIDLYIQSIAWQPGKRSDVLASSPANYNMSLRPPGQTIECLCVRPAWRRQPGGWAALTRQTRARAPAGAWSSAQQKVWPSKIQITLLLIIHTHIYMCTWLGLKNNRLKQIEQMHR